MTGKGKVTATSCNLTSIAFKCVSVDRNAACAAFVKDDISEWLFVGYFDGREQVRQTSRTEVLPLLKNNDTLSGIAMYAAHERNLSPLLLQLAAGFQAAPNSTVVALRGERLISEIDVKLFLPSVIIVACVLSISLLLGIFQCI